MLSQLIKRNYWAREIIISNPVLFQTIWKLKFRQQSHLFVAKDTEIVIEGFPRSANTFAVVAFKIMQGERNVKVAHHLHAPAQIISGVKKNIPCVVLAREPLGAVVSLLVQRNLTAPHINPEVAINSYLHFYTSILPMISNCVVSDFKSTTKDLCSTVAAVNSKFDSDFSVNEISDEDVFLEIEKISRMYPSSSALTISAPRSEKKEHKEYWTKAICSSKELRTKLDKADRLYRRVVSEAAG